jgi:hypothetical protein
MKIYILTTKTNLNLKHSKILSGFPEMERRLRNLTDQLATLTEMDSALVKKKEKKKKKKKKKRTPKTQILLKGYGCKCIYFTLQLFM